MPFDDGGPLDRIVRPDDLGEETLGDLINKDYEDAADAKTPKGVPEPPLASQRPLAARPMDAPAEDTYILEQVHKLVEYQTGKIYRTMLKGAVPSKRDMEALDKWLNEFKRLGGY